MALVDPIRNAAAQIIMMVADTNKMIDKNARTPGSPILDVRDIWSKVFSQVESIMREHLTPPPAPPTLADVPAGAVVVERALLRRLMRPLCLSVYSYDRYKDEPHRSLDQQRADVAKLEQLLQESGDGSR